MPTERSGLCKTDGAIDYFIYQRGIRSNLGIVYCSLLNELYSLRDALLAAVYRLGYKRNNFLCSSKIEALGIERADGVGRLIRNSMFSADGDLLIDHMSLY